MSPLPPQIAAIKRPIPPLWNYYILKAIATNFAFPVTIVVFYFRYHTMRYVFDEEGVRMSWGIIFRNEVMLNYARIQDIQLRSNVIERWLGLARIEIQTASGSSRATITLEGIEDYNGMRDFLYSRMRGAKQELRSGGKTEDKLAATLNEIATELRAIRTELESQRGSAR
jgi:putative membrane protein